MPNQPLSLMGRAVIAIEIDFFELLGQPNLRVEAGRAREKMHFNTSMTYDLAYVYHCQPDQRLYSYFTFLE